MSCQSLDKAETRTGIMTVTMVSTVSPTQTKEAEKQCDGIDAQRCQPAVSINLVPDKTSDDGWSLPRTPTPSELGPLPAAVFAEIWDAIVKEKSVTGAIQKQKDELVLMVDADCPINCCTPYPDYFQQKQVLENRIQKNWRALVQDVKDKLDSSLGEGAVNVAIATDKVRKPIGNLPVHKSKGFFDEVVVVGLRFETTRGWASVAAAATAAAPASADGTAETAVVKVDAECMARV